MDIKGRGTKRRRKTMVDKESKRGQKHENGYSLNSNILTATPKPLHSSPKPLLHPLQYRAPPRRKPLLPNRLLKPPHHNPPHNKRVLPLLHARPLASEELLKPPLLRTVQWSIHELDRPLRRVVARRRL